MAVAPLCRRPPKGWYCTIGDGHDGPCAAHPHPGRWRLMCSYRLRIHDEWWRMSTLGPPPAKHVWHHTTVIGQVLGRWAGVAVLVPVWLARRVAW